MRGSSTRAARLKRYGFNLILSLVYIGIPVFAVLVLYPVAADWREGTEELREAESVLGRWLQAMSLPTQSQIEAERRYTAALAAEYDLAKGYYLSRDGLLERRLLGSYGGDPVQVKLKYMELRSALAAKGRCEDPRAFLPPYSWEAPKLEPPRSEFKAIEKRACIADVLVDLVGSMGVCSIKRIVIADPVDPLDESEEFPPGGSAAASDAENECTYVLWPVEMDFVTPFASAGVLLDRLVTPPARYPPVLMHSLHLVGLDDGQVSVSVGLRVLDFD